jgi:TonB-dependent starch-binding outer membrane protein SusC
MRKLLLLLGFSMLCLLQTAWAQTKEVTGKVTDDKGVPIAGATIQEKGSRKATATDASGAFKLAVKEGASLVITYIGFDKKEVTTANLDDINIALKSNGQSLSEVVVTGVGAATSKRKVAISVESITADKLPAAPTASIDQALVGKIPGAQISSIDGTPGARTNILLRGINTLQRGTKPLILIDGIEVQATDINALDLNNIERVEVVQGAAAATIYGAQGANGVIQLFTKKGKIGTLSIDISSNYSVGTYLNNGGVAKAALHGFKTDGDNNVVSAAGDIAALNDVGAYEQQIVWARTLAPDVIVNKAYNKNLKYYDHFQQFLAPAATYNNSIRISGGAGKTDFSFSASNSKQESAIRNNGAINRSNFTSNIGTELFKGFKFRSITQLVYTKGNLNPFFGVGRNSVFDVLNISPFYDLNWKDKDGNNAYFLSTGAVSANGYNPNYTLNYLEEKDDKIDVIQNFQASYAVNKFLDLDAKYGINYQKQEIKDIYKNQSANASSNYTGDWAFSSVRNGNSADNTGEIRNYNYTTTFQNALLTAFIKTDFEKDFGWNIPIKTNTQVSFDYRKNVYKDYQTVGIGLKQYPIYNINQAASSRVIFDFVQPFVTYGYLVNQKFEFGDFAGVSGGFRTDYSSAFGKGSTPFTFPRADAFLRLSQLNFWNGALKDRITEFKLRGAYGQAGIQPLPFDRYLTLATTNFGNTSAFYTNSSLSNPDLRVERSKELELGTDISVSLSKSNWLQNANIGFTYWDRKGNDVIYDIDAAPSSGGHSTRNNAFALASNGVQFSLNLNVLNSKDFTWDFTTNFGRQTSKITSTANGQDVVLQSSAGSTNLVLRAGDKIGQIYGSKALRSLDATRKDGTPYIDKADYALWTISSDGYVVNKATKRIAFTNESYAFGDPNPKFNASFINNIGYKGYLTFGFQFDWVYGSHLYNQTKEWMYRDGIHADYAKPVTIDGQTAAFGTYYQSAYSDQFGSINGARNGTKDYFYEDASFVRLRNISLGVDIAKMAKLTWVKKLQLVLTGRNVLTFTKYTGFDPEISSTIASVSSTVARVPSTVSTATIGNSAFERGIDHNSMPNIKSFLIGLNIGF